MCLFKKKQTADKVKEDRELVAQNSKLVDGLIVIAGANEELVKDLQQLKEQIKYLIPSDNSKIVDYDKTVKNKIEDLRIALIKDDGESSKKASALIRDIKLAIADRNARL